MNKLKVLNELAKAKGDQEEFITRLTDEANLIRSRVKFRLD